jgi:hypothetical protein
MSPAPPLGSWWMDHLQLPGYDPIATAGACHFDLRAAEQALDFVTQLLPSPLSSWEAAIVLNLWGWRQVDGRRRYVTVYAEPYRQDALALWCATLGLLLLCTAPPTPGTTGDCRICPGHPGRGGVCTRHSSYCTDARVGRCPPMRPRTPGRGHATGWDAGHRQRSSPGPG